MLVLCRNPSRECKHEPIEERTQYGQLQRTLRKTPQETSGGCRPYGRGSGREDEQARRGDIRQDLLPLGGKSKRSETGILSGDSQGPQNQEHPGALSEKIILQICKFPVDMRLQFCRMHLSQRNRCIIHSPASPAPLRHNEQAASGFFLEFFERALAMSTLLIEFFEEEFLPAQDLAPIDVKKFRNAIGRLSQILGHPAEFGDVITGFKTTFVENLLRLGFTMGRAEAFARCIRLLRDAMREAKRVTPTPHQENLIEQAFAYMHDFEGSLKQVFTDIIFDDDQVLSGAVHELETIQRHIDESEVA